MMLTIMMMMMTIGMMMTMKIRIMMMISIIMMMILIYFDINDVLRLRTRPRRSRSAPIAMLTTAPSKRYLSGWFSSLNPACAEHHLSSVAMMIALMLIRDEDDGSDDVIASGWPTESSA